MKYSYLMSKSFSFYRFELCARYFHTDVTAFGMHWMQKVRQWMTYSFSPVTQCHPVFPSIACLPDTKWHFQATFKISPVPQGSYIFILRGDPVSPCVTQCGPVLPSVTLCYLCHPVWPSIAAFMTLSSCRGVIDEMHICKPDISRQHENYLFLAIL